MPTNLELKAKITSPQKLTRALRALGKPSARLAQTDTYFRVRNGRLKLRQIGKGAGELIYYRRNEKRGRRWSHYSILHISDTRGAKRILTSALGVDVVVRKIRQVYIYKKAARIHIDKVAGLGNFIEFEVVHQGDKNASLLLYKELKKLFEVDSRNVVRCSYSDLVRGRL